MSYVWECREWPEFTYSSDRVSEALKHLYNEKQAADIAYSIVDADTKKQIAARNLTEDIISSLSIEGDAINADSIYSSISKHLDISFTGKESAYSKSISDMVLDALEDHSPMTHQRLFKWNRKLFENKAGIKPKVIGEYRITPEYVMRVSGKNRDVIYEAVKPDRVYNEMDRLIRYINEAAEDCFVKASIASLWLVLIHPFEDGNGRISRALADYIISGESESKLQSFNISTGILKDRVSYYEHIQMISSNDLNLDITSWIIWFLDIVTACINQSMMQLKRTLKTSSFMKTLDPNEYNSREIIMLYKLIDGSFYGKLTTDKWIKMTKCSKTAAFRDIQHLVKKGFLISSGEEGRNTGYYLSLEAISSVIADDNYANQIK